MDREDIIIRGLMLVLVIVTAIVIGLGIYRFAIKGGGEGVVVYKFHESEHSHRDTNFNGKFFTRSTSVDDEDWGLVLNYNGEHGIVRVSESEWNQVCVGEYFNNVSSRTPSK